MPLEARVEAFAAAAHRFPHVYIRTAVSTGKDAVFLDKKDYNDGLPTGE